MLWKCAVALLALRIGCIETKGNKIFQVPLDTTGSRILHWTLNYISDSITFEVHLPALHVEWFAIGFSDRGELYPADYCLIANGWNNFKLLDTWVDENGILHVDNQQDCDGFKIRNVGNVTKFTYRRKFDTCDPQDYIIEEGTTHVVWMSGKGPIFNVNGINIINNDLNTNGMVRVRLLKNTEVDYKLPNHVKQIDILNNKVKVPPEETTYWCRVVKLPDEFAQKHHVYQYESNIQKSSEGLVHHMEVFHCMATPDEDIPIYEGSCFSNNRPPATYVCKRVLAAWAMGATPFIYPEEAGLPIGGKDFNLFLMLEVHYNNPEKRSGIIDSSGIRFYTSDVLKEMDAGVLELGLEYSDKMAIPPRQESFPLTGYCVSGCTALSLPFDGITIFASQLHTHLTGVKVITRHIRNGVELSELNRDNHYSTHFQEIRRLKHHVKVLPGDALVTKCDYKTDDRENITLGGFSISDEMCVNYVHYFPATELEVCKSSISDQALFTYFRYMNEWEGQSTSPQNSISDNYKIIEWNKMRVQLLQEVYQEAPLSMQCNMSSGDRFPGYWENTPLSQISFPLPPPKRLCSGQMYM